MATNPNEENEFFAAIAAQTVNYRDDRLIEPEPAALPEKVLPLGAAGSDNAFEVIPKIGDAEALGEELEKWRARYEPFMRKLSPPISETRLSIALTKFDWRVQTEADRADFSRVLGGGGDWEEVEIPHFGPPLGKATTYYRRTIEITGEQLAVGAAFLSFKGVDYKAHVFLNGSYLGSHEGFFASFEFECGDFAHVGENVLVVRVDNDFVVGGNRPWGTELSGDKIYAVTGLGYDEPEVGWHCCPPGMGICQDVCLEFRARSFVSDIYVRPLPEEKRAEVWVEVFQCDPERREMEFQISVFGRNFEAKVVEGFSYSPSVIHECGVGDALQIALAKAAGTYRKPTPLKVGPGPNIFKISIDMEEFRYWSPESPWLYQAQVRMLDQSGVLLDAAERHFGMRSFHMDEEGDVKGALSFNGKPVRLRGANTMGHEQQCVLKKDWKQLRDDILLAKICNMNFLRLTQRPVQSEVYDFCDMLGLMTQCDFPTFGEMRRNQYPEMLRQVGEMERLVRAHPCNIMVTYINEPVNNSGNEPHRFLSREEMEEFFDAADKIVRRLNPERVIKACDGDYDPPSPGLQDRHCYCTWYNGQGVDIGKLHKGYWQPTKAGWFYGCGEFGAEGLECTELMNCKYPAAWLPDPNKDEKQWSPNQISFAQTGRFHYFYFETPDSVEGWVSASQTYQASAMRMMAEAFRRDNRMVTCAIHLFIDAFPTGWMKTIMDCDRRPKLAYFAYRNAMAPLLVTPRTDRSRFFSGDSIEVEAWICNDRPEVFEGVELRYQLRMNGEAIAGGVVPAEIHSCRALCQGLIHLDAPVVGERSKMTVHLALVNSAGKTLNDNSIEIEVFSTVVPAATRKVSVIGNGEGDAAKLAAEMGAAVVDDAPVMLVDDMAAFESDREAILQRVGQGARLVVLGLNPGVYQFGGHELKVKVSGFNALHFASRDTGHELVEGFQAHDFRHWYDPAAGYISPIIHNTFTAETGDPILLSGNTNDKAEWTGALAAAEFGLGSGSVIVCQVELAGRTSSNPPARRFAERLLQPS